MSSTAAADPALGGLELDAEIRRLKKERNAILLAHVYQQAEIQDVADFVGDSLQLAQQARATDRDVIVFAGVHFMAEVAKILNPERTVLVPHLGAGCHLADGCPADEFIAWRARHPGAIAISYINCSAAVKAESDYICTSSNAVRVVGAMPEDRTILFAPDRNLGRYAASETGRDLVLWPGSCTVHVEFSRDGLLELHARHPEAKIIAHPECEPPILELADFIGSTAGLIRFAENDPGRKYLVVTESGILHEMRKRMPDKTFLPAPPTGGRPCSVCEFMRLNTPEKVYLALRDMQPELTMDESLRERARIPIDRMLALS